MSFPRYPVYKPSGVEWLGEVPELKQVTDRILEMMGGLSG